MPLIDVIDESFLYAEPARLASRLRDPALLRRWWPDLELDVFQDRGEAGMRWTVTGALVGTSEIWLEPVGEGVVLHYYLRADPTRPGSRTEPVGGSADRVVRLARRRATQHTRGFKRSAWALKDELERDRPAGEPPAASDALPTNDSSAGPDRPRPKG